MNDGARRAWELVQNHLPLTTSEIAELRPVVEGAGIRVEPRERTQCRHGVGLAFDCSECAKTPETLRTWFPSDELAAVALGSALEERRRAEAWMDTAAQYADGQQYYRKERDGLLRFVEIVANPGDMRAIWEQNKMLVEEPPK